jgi:hypothetical protein
MPTTEELIDEYVGRKAKYVTMEGFVIEVTVQNVKTHFGRTDLEVVPLHGAGTKWVTQAKLQFGSPKSNGQLPPADNEINW